MNRPVCILGGGGVAGVGMTRCLQSDFDVSAWDDNPWARKVVECPLDEEQDGDLIVPLADSLIRLWAGRPKTFLPPTDVIERCQEKHLTAKLLGDLAPLTYWVRDVHGAGGAGAAKLTGQMAAEYLPGRNISCEVVYWQGKLKAHFVKERLSYKVNYVEPSVQGIGSSAVSRCLADGNVLDIARWAVKRIAGEPHGVFGVDLKEDEYGNPKITEINPGRFLTASYVYFARTGYNLPRLMCELALELPETPLPEYPEGVGVIRQTDSLPWCGRLPRFDHTDFDTDKEQRDAKVRMQGLRERGDVA